jgi:trk system potassium uptake protein TrkA
MVRNVVIVGGGRVGRHVAEELGEAQHRITIVEIDPERCQQAPPKVRRVVEGDGTDPEVLEKADLAHADVVAALTDDTGVNLTVCDTVSEAVPDVRTILRIARDGEQEHGHRHSVDSIVYPAAAGAAVTVDRIERM